MRKAGLLIAAILLIGAAAGLWPFLHPHPTKRPHSVTLTWHAAADSPGSKVVSYNVYRSTSSEGPYARVASAVPGLSYKDELVNPGVTYYYVVKSVDDSGRESRPSEAVTVTVPGSR